MNLKLKLYSSKLFLISRDKWKIIEFHVKKFIYKRKDNFSNQKTTFKISLTYWKNALLKIIKPIIIIILFFNIEIFLTNFGKQNWQNISPLIRNLYLLFPNIIDSKQDYFNIVIPYLSVIASVSGLILALFFPILTSIITTAFTKVRSDLRYLIIEEPNSQYFIKNITFILVFTILTLFSLIIGYRPSILILSFITFLSIRGFYYLIKIGFGIFNLFDPNSIVKIIIQNIYKDLLKSTNDDLFYNDKSFQNAYYLNTYRNIERLEISIRLITKEKDLQSDSLQEAIKHILNYLLNYSQLKHKIPNDSLWFKKNNKYQSFFSANHFTKELALEFDSMMQPEQIIEYNWIETSLINIIFESLIELKSSNKLEITNQVFYQLNDFSKKIGRNYNIDLLQLILFNCNKLLTENFNEQININLKFSDEILSNKKSHLSILECYFKIYQNFTIELSKKCLELEKNKFQELITNFSLKYDSKIFDIIPSIKPALIKINRLIQNEKKIEGKQTTPSWFIIQSAATEYILNLKNTIDKLIELFELFTEMLNKIGNNKEPFFASCCILFGLENINYCERHLALIISVIKEFDEIKRNKETTWIPIDFEVWNQTIKNKRISYLTKLSEYLPYLSTLNKSDDLPDYFGQAYSIVSKEIGEALYNNNYELFAKLFKTLLPVSILTSDSLRKDAQNKKLNDTWQIKVSNQTIFDILEISALGLIYSAIYDNYSYQYFILESWNKYLDVINVNAYEGYEITLIQQIATRYSLSKNSSYGMELNYEIKHQRKLQLLNKFKELKINITRENISKQSILTVNDIIVENPLIRLIYPINHDFSFDFDFKEIFLELYILCRLSSVNIKKEYRRKFFNRINYFYDNRDEYEFD